MRLTELYKTIEEAQVEKVASATPEVVDNTEELVKMAEEYVTMGRLMARGYIDEMDKIAGLKEIGKKAIKGTKNYVATVKDAVHKATMNTKEEVKNLKGSAPHGRAKDIVHSERMHGLKTLGTHVAAPAVGIAAGAYGVKKLTEKKKEK